MRARWIIGLSLAVLLSGAYAYAQKQGVTVFDSTGQEVIFQAQAGGGSTIQYSQGTPTTDTDSLVMVGCVRTDTPAIATGVAVGDRVRCIVDALGNLWVRPVWQTPTGGALVDDTNDAIRVSPVTVITVQGKTHATTTFTILAADGPQTNRKLLTVGPGVKVRVSRAHVACSSQNIAGTDVRLGFGTLALPARSLGGAPGVFLDRFKLAPGQEHAYVAAAVEEGAADEDVLLTMDAPAGGGCSVTLAYETM